jgi:Fic family protein
MPFEPKFSITSNIATSLMRIEAARQAVQDLPITPSVRATLRKTARLYSTHYSTMIEGNRLTQEQVSKVIGISTSQRDSLPCPIRAGIAHYQFATIHPYYDGTGRTARLLTTLILHLGGYDLKGLYSLEEYYARNLGDYYKALTVGPITPSMKRCPNQRQGLRPI